MVTTWYYHEQRFILYLYRFAANKVVHLFAGEEDRQDEVGGEYCLSESFNASCRQVGQVIVMTAAEYGRMRSGRCVQMKYGQPGCRENVLGRLDAHCSGRPACSFPVARLLQAGIAPCDTELKSYLYATYRCVTGLPTTIYTPSAMPYSVKIDQQ